LIFISANIFNLNEAAASLANNKTGAAAAANVKTPTATQIAMQVFKQKGFLGFYQGGTATLVRDVFFSALYFPLFAFFNSKVNLLKIFFLNFYYYILLIFKSIKGTPDPVTNKPAFYHTFGSGIAAGSIAAYIATPLDGNNIFYSMNIFNF
jgi:hypothetical protein